MSHSDVLKVEDLLPASGLLCCVELQQNQVKNQHLRHYEVHFVCEYNADSILRKFRYLKLDEIVSFLRKIASLSSNNVKLKVTLDGLHN